ncbi:MAG: hypothetical protein L3K25_04435 [Gammaproteobacteria bacterium]|nr:hypothetical protein [Gammaproteobacteria bacterium]
MLSTNIKLKRKLSIHVPVLLLAAITVLPATSVASDVRTWVKKLHPTTGFNTDCNTPVFNLPAPLPADLHFDVIGLYNPDAPAEGDMRDAFTLQQSDCENSLGTHIATTSNLDLLAMLGAPEPDSRLKNLRTHEIPKIAAPDGTRFTLPPAGSVTPPFPPTNTATNQPLTLGEFRGVKGKMKVKCYADGTSHVKIKLRNYQPHELLTIWAIWLTTPPGAAEPAPVPLPFGGVPNVTVANKHGVAKFTRTLSYCPMDTLPTGEQLLMLDIASHVDGNVYGAVPGTPPTETTFVDPNDPSNTFTSPLSEGIVTLTRGAIPMTVHAVRRY